MYQISPPSDAPLYYPAGNKGCSNGDIGAANNDEVVFQNGTEIWTTSGRLLNVNLPCFDPKMSPDGRWVACVMVESGSLGQILLYDRHNHQQFKLTNTKTGSNRFPWLDYDENADLWLGWISNAVDLDPSKTTANDSAIIYRFRDAYQRIASWGPHGIFDGNVVTQATGARWTLFDSDATNSGFNNHGCRQVYLHNSDTMENLLISRNDDGVVLTTGESIQPRMSANRRRILFQSRATEIVISDNARVGNGEMFVSDLDSGKLWHCTPFYGESADGHISPDGKLVAFETNAPNVPGYSALPNGSMSSFIYSLENGRYTMLNTRPGDGITHYGHPRIANDGSAVFNCGKNSLWQVMGHTREETETA